MIIAHNKTLEVLYIVRDTDLGVWLFDNGSWVRALHDQWVLGHEWDVAIDRATDAEVEWFKRKCPAQALSQWSPYLRYCGEFRIVMYRIEYHRATMDTLRAIVPAFEDFDGM